ncbi:hypothetical protein [Paenibacillus naphthalenovorans]|uniref:Uncharacterized protein n=1 Tax=Paenibacillus naphthalenovorans TaxID=162209 RepID=A0A0U2UG36_9BACL|nr:hypothetical protein [Paenibacillus naphthalenovorans]ALS22140.1 hypothetical protein IJ22_17660 [Paenibacillus naphthalenovorans]
MKITPKALKQFQELCPLSSSKCNSYHEIEYKIHRCIQLGEIAALNNDGSRQVNYYHLKFTIKGDKVIDIRKDKGGRYVHVSEKAKNEYDIIHSKIMV